jgi:hypothetical protein
MGLSSKLLGPGERKKKQVDWSHLLIITVSGNAFALLSELLGLAYFLSPVFSKLVGLAYIKQFASPYPLDILILPLKRSWLQESD